MIKISAEIENDYNFNEGDELSDMKLVVEDKTLHVHKAILGIKAIFVLIKNIYLK